MQTATATTDSNSAIRVDNLTKYYGRPGAGVLAVDHINFEVHQGEIFGFLGPTGPARRPPSAC